MNSQYILEVQVWKTREQFNEQQSYAQSDSGFCHVGYLDIVFSDYRSARSWVRSRKSRLDTGVRLTSRKYGGEALNISKPFIINSNLLSSEIRGRENEMHSPSLPNIARRISYMLEYQACILGDNETWYHLGYGTDLAYDGEELALAVQEAEEAIKLGYEQAVRSRAVEWNESRWPAIRDTYRYIPRHYNHELRGVTSFYNCELLKRTLPHTYVNRNLHYLCCERRREHLLKCSETRCQLEQSIG